MSNKTYDTLKLISLVVLPIGTFIGSICEIWGIYGAEQIRQTFVALNVLCGSLVAISAELYKRNHYDGP